MYIFDIKNVVPLRGLTCLFTKATIDESNLWHRRLGHINFKTMNKLVKGNLVRGLPSKLFENDHTCVACQKGKQRKASFVTDDFSIFSWVLFLATKDETYEILKNFITCIENQIDHKVITIKCDNETEFKNMIMNEFCEIKGIKREFSVPRTPQQNGVAERKNRTLIEAVRTMLADSKLPTTFWIFLDQSPCPSFFDTACYVQNRVLVIKPHNKTPYELFLGRKHALSFMKPCRYPVTILNTLDYLEDKVANDAGKKNEVQDPAKEGDKNGQEKDVRDQEEPLRKQFKQEFKRFFGRERSQRNEFVSMIGQNKNDNGNSTYRMFTPVSATGSFYDNLGGSIHVNADTLPNANLPTDPLMPDLEDTVIFSPIPITRIHKDHPKKKIIGDLLSVPQTRRMTKTSQEHAMVNQALTCPSWIEAMQDELLQFRLQKIWRLVDLPNGKHAIGTKWIYRNKKDERAIVVRNKARLVAQGHTQEKGFNYDEVFAPVARIEEIMLFLAYALFMGFSVYQMDVKSAFLYEIIDEEVCVCQPPVFEDPQFPDKVYKVEKDLYGLHQALRAWYETLSTYLLENRFKREIIDKTLFIKKDKGDILLVQVYVDDIIFGSTKKSLCTKFEGLMHKKFQMSSMGELTFFLGLQVMHRNDGIFISQDKHVADILKKFNFFSVKTASTLIETNKALLKDEEVEDIDVHLYRLMTGLLMYLIASRHDIMFVVCACARFQVTPKVLHLHVVKRIFRYLKGSTSGIKACALRNFDLEVMEFETTQNNTTAKLPLLKLGEYKMWEMRIKQYFQVKDYALWEVIENGNSWVSVPQTTQENGTSVLKMSVPVTAEEKSNKKNDVKARSLLLMALTNEHLLTFTQYSDAKTLYAAIKTRFRDSKILLVGFQFGCSYHSRKHKFKFLRSLPPEWNTHVVIWMNKDDIETMSINDLYNNFKIFEQEVKKYVGTSTGTQNMAFMTAPSTSSTNNVNTANSDVSTVSTNVNTANPKDSTSSLSDATLYAFLANQPNGSQLVHEDLEQIHDDDHKEIDLKWQLALLRYDNSKVECFNCHKMRHFARESKNPRNQDSRPMSHDNWNMNKDSTRKTVNVEETSSKAMLAIDDSEVYNHKSCSKTCLKNFQTLKKQCDDLIVKLNETEFQAATYKRGLAIVEDQLVSFRKNEVLFSEEIVVLKREVGCKDYEIGVLKTKYEKVKQEKEGIDFKIVKFDKSLKSLGELLESQITNKSKKGLGYNVVSPPHTLIYNRTTKLDLSYSGLNEFKEPEFNRYGPRYTVLKSTIDCDKDSDNSKENTDESLEKEQVTDNESSSIESPLKFDKETVIDWKETVFHTAKKVEFVKLKNNEKPFKKSVIYVEMYRSQSPRGNQRNWNGQKSNQLGSEFVMYNKACYGCGSFDHIQTNCPYHQKKRMESGNNYNRVDYNYYAKTSHPRTHRNMTPRAVLLKFGLTSLSTARPVYTAQSKPTVHSARPMTNFSKQAQLTVQGPFYKKTTLTNRNFNQKFNTVRPRVVNTARQHIAPVNTVRANGFNAGKPQVNDKGFIDSGCSRHMTDANTMENSILNIKMCDKKNYVLFADTECLVLSPDFKFPNESQILLRIPRENNMYSFDMKNIVPKESLTCLVAKATSDKSMILIIKPYNKTPYELFRGIKSALSFMKPFGCHVTILNTLDSLGKFNGKSNEGFFVGYSLSSKDFRVQALMNLHVHKKIKMQKVGYDYSKYAFDDPKEDEDGSYDENDDKEKSEDDGSTKQDNTTDQPVNIARPSHSFEVTHVEFFNDKDEPDVDLGNISKSYVIRRMTKPNSEHGFLSAVYEEKTHEDLYTCLFACFLSHEEPKKISKALSDPAWEVYVCQPLRFEDLDYPNKVYKVVKALYGLHQAPSTWYETLANYLLGNGFYKGKIDQTLFIKKQKGDILLVQIYVDDIIFGSTKKELCTKFEKLMKDKFQMISILELTFFLGLQVQQRKDGIFISQDKYVDEILRKFNNTNVKSASTPVDLEKPLVKDGDATDDVHVSIFKLHQKHHILAVKRIFRYLKGKPTLGLWYSKDSLFELVPYIDSDYAGATQDRKSTTRCCQFLGNRLISWQCKKQTVVVTSTTEAEYVVTASCCRQVYCLREGKLCKKGYVTLDKKCQKHWKVKRGRDTKVPQSGGPAIKVGDEVVHKELGDRMERAATTASSLEAE
nr:putative ribonuclease H-like domain-containing protein [Tanacetum cinerariifolium]